MKYNKALIFLWLIMMSMSKTITLGMDQKMYRNYLSDNYQSQQTIYNGTKNNNKTYDDNKNNNNAMIQDNDNDNKMDFTTNDLPFTMISKELNMKNVMKNLWTYFNDNLITYITTTTTTTTSGSRTFGKMRRLQQILIPLAFKFGVLFSMVAVLLLLSLKTFFLLKILILINVVAILSKFFTLKSSTDDQYSQIIPSHGHYVGSSSIGISGNGPWIPHHLNEYPHMGKEVHLHIHGNVGGGGGGGGGGVVSKDAVNNGIHDNFITSSHLIPSYYSKPNIWKRNLQISNQDKPKNV